jgi:anaerobic ribonucleoside-triphosphate reductase
LQNIILGITTIYPAEMTLEEATEYIKQELKIWKKPIDRAEIVVDGEYVEVRCKERSPIIRIRRITGYLSEITSFNDAKQAEEHDRYKHVDLDKLAIRE